MRMCVWEFLQFHASQPPHATTHATRAQEDDVGNTKETKTPDSWTLGCGMRKKG